MAGNASYWPLQFLSENHLTSPRQVEGFLPQYGVLKTLQQRAEDASSGGGFVADEHERNIVAGSGVDLNGGGMVCPSPSCVRGQIDILFKHIWHYFDSVVVNDVLTPLLTAEWRGSKKSLLAEIARLLAPLLYLQEIGGAEYVRFLPKPEWCYEGLDEHAREEGLDEVVTAKQELIDRLLRDGNFSFTTKDKQRLVCLSIDEVTTYRVVDRSGDDKAKLALARRVFDGYLVELTSDVAAARQYNLPLGLVQSLAGEMMQMSRPPSVADVMFQLELPVLSGISTGDLIRVRLEYSEYFRSFRNALARAIKDRLGASETQPSAQIAEEIRADVIEPELDKIRRSLVSAEQSLAKKTGVGIVLAALTTTCGILLGIAPPVAGSAGVATAVGVTGMASSRHLDEVRETSLNDMYFLWKAIGHAH